jgi:hypothetical protein
MTPTIYSINRGINQPIQFQGLKAQYILYAAGIIVAGLLLFALLYISGLTPWLDLPICFGLGGLGVSRCYRNSRKYGEFGRAKAVASGKTPATLRHRTRKTFTQLLHANNQPAWKKH